MKRKYCAPMTIIFMAFMMTCCITATAIASNQPPEGFHPKGPAIKAEITFEEEIDGITISGSGMCGGKPVVFFAQYIAGQTLNDITPEALLDNYVAFQTGFLPKTPDGNVAECVPVEAVGMIVRAVIDFQDEGESILAEIILLFAVP